MLSIRSTISFWCFPDSWNSPPPLKINIIMQSSWLSEWFWEGCWLLLWGQLSEMDVPLMSEVVCSRAQCYRMIIVFLIKCCAWSYKVWTTGESVQSTETGLLRHESALLLIWSDVQLCTTDRPSCVLSHVMEAHNYHYHGLIHRFVCMSCILLWFLVLLCVI